MINILTVVILVIIYFIGFFVTTALAYIFAQGDEAYSKPRIIITIILWPIFWIIIAVTLALSIPIKKKP